MSSQRCGGSACRVPVLMRLFLLCVAGGLAASAAYGANPFAPAEFTATQNVLWDDIEPLGVNLTLITGGTNLTTNNFIAGGGMEPGLAKYLVRIERVGPGWIEWDASQGGVHMWEQNATGYGDGATVRLYRIVDANGQPLSYAGGSDMSNVTGSERVIFLGETTVPTGGWVAEGEGTSATNRVQLADSSLQLAYSDHAIITVTKRRLEQSEVHPRLHQWFQPQVNILRNFNGSTDYEARLVPHPGTLPPAFSEPGATCLQLSNSASSEVSVGQYIFHAFDQGEGQWYSQLEPGAPYRAEVWLRQQGVANGRVQFVGVGPYSSITQSAPWSVTDQWVKYIYDFVGPGYPAPGTFHGGLGLSFEGPGTVWVDNFVVYRNDAAHGNRPFTPHRLAFDELMAAMPPTGPKPAVRFFTATYYNHSTMERMLSRYANSVINFIYNVQPSSQIMTVPICMEWALATGNTPAERVVPYIALSEEYTEREWAMLAEYLGVPYDPAVDTPQAKPWAHRRYQHRGHGRPWTEEFREIVIEVGNETWHAGVFAGWDGFGRPNWVNFGGREYGLFMRHYFAEHVMAQPWWSRHDLGSKLKIALGASYEANTTTAYGELAAQAAPQVTSYLGHANYVGPKWETGEVPFAVFDDHGVQETLVGAYLEMFPLIQQVGAARQQLLQAGLADYRPIAYEGGPSGYFVPGRGGTPEQEAISQLYGKSAAMAVSAMDAWLYSSLNGYTHQCFYAYAAGRNWTSHTMPRAGGFRRHAGWLALMMRNLYVPGREMLTVDPHGVPTYERSGQVIPLTSAYAIRSADTYSLFVLSRKLDGNHDGVDFGDGTTPVTVHLPFNRCTRLTRYALTAPDGSPVDPRANNLTSENVVISSVELDPNVIASGDLVIGPNTGGVAGGLPPGSIYLYSFGIEPQLNGDIDDDGDTDVHDAAYLAICVSDQVPPGQVNCTRTDLDRSGVVDGSDFSRLEACLNGADRSPSCPQ